MIKALVILAILLAGCDMTPQDELVCYKHDLHTRRYDLTAKRLKTTKVYSVDTTFDMEDGENCIATLYDVGKKFSDPFTHFFFKDIIKMPMRAEWTNSFPQTIMGKTHQVDIVLFTWGEDTSR